MRKFNDITNINGIIDKLYEVKSSLAFIAESSILVIDSCAKSEIDYKPPVKYAEGLFTCYSYLDLTIHSVIYALEGFVKDDI